MLPQPLEADETSPAVDEAGARSRAVEEADNFYASEISICGMKS